MGLEIFNRKPKKREQIIVIDLGARTTKAVHLQAKGSTYQFVRYALTDSPIYDKIPSPELLSEHLKKVWQSLNTRFKHVILAIGVTDAVIKHADLPLMPVNEMRTMVKFNTKGYLQQEMPDYIFDGYIIPPRSSGPTGTAESLKPGQKVRVVVGGAKKQFLQDLQTAGKLAGLTVDAIIPGTLGPVNAYELTQPESFLKDTIALVDLGFKNSSVNIIMNGDLMLHRVVAIGGDRLTSGLTEVMNMSYAEAEGIKVGMPQEVEAALGPLITPLGRELRASIDFFEHQYDKTVSAIYVCGGSAQSEYILKCLHMELSVACKTWNPTGFLEVALGPDQMGEYEQILPQLTVAIGSAMAFA